MSRKLTASSLFVLGALAVAATAQPPASPPPASPPAADKKPPEKKAADPLDALIAAALANDPEVRIARAKMQLAEAEVAKARQATVARVVGLQASIQEQKSEVAAAEENHNLLKEQVNRAVMPYAAFLTARDRLATAKAGLARLEAQLKVITGEGPGSRVAAGDVPQNTMFWAELYNPSNGVGNVGSNIVWAKDVSRENPFTLYRQQELDNPRHARGPIPEQVRAALDRKVKLGAKDEKVLFARAMEVFKKEAGLDVPVRDDFGAAPVTSLGEELPVGAWFQMFADANPDARFLVREYGILVTNKLSAPPDAATVFDLWKQKPTNPPGTPDKPAVPAVDPFGGPVVPGSVGPKRVDPQPNVTNR